MSINWQPGAAGRIAATEAVKKEYDEDKEALALKYKELAELLKEMAELQFRIGRNSAALQLAGLIDEEGKEAP